MVRTPGQFRSSLLALDAPSSCSPSPPSTSSWRLRRFGGDELLLPALLLLTGIGLAMMLTIRDPLRDLPLYRGFAAGRRCSAPPCCSAPA